MTAEISAALNGRPLKLAMNTSATGRSNHSRSNASGTSFFGCSDQCGSRGSIRSKSNAFLDRWTVSNTSTNVSLASRHRHRLDGARCVSVRIKRMACSRHGKTRHSATAMTGSSRRIDSASITSAQFSHGIHPSTRLSTAGCCVSAQYAQSKSLRSTGVR
ncbi:hypothetical protein D3C72_1901260 [compost metagenome]